ncbi:MAG: 3'(2'),5'-bisphosphate nucleotidase CysQ, partial [Saprospiraceae bacterium]|nr:3'(2'),5'-bisphosphate nucleotidase CysQ [Saprospiraceae bacterium]
LESGPQQLQVNNYHKDDEGLRIVCSRSHLNEATQAFMDQFCSPEKVSTGSSLKFLIIANGDAEIYPRLAPTMEWDTAAAQIILEEAGGTVYQAETNTPVVYNKENLLNPQFIASANQSH